MLRPNPQQLFDTTNYLALRSTFIINNFDKDSDTTKSLKLIKETEKIYKHYKNRDDAAISNMNDAYMLKYFLKKKYDSALSYNQESANYFKKGGNEFFHFIMLAKRQNYFS